MQVEQLSRNGLSNMQSLIRLDIACGSTKQDGWTGIDITPIDGVDIVHNLLEFPWPITSESVGEARCFHYLEHIPMTCVCCGDRPDPLLQTFEEMYRILIPGGTILIECPHALSLRAWQDPTHRRAISENTFNYTSSAWRKEHGVDHYGLTCNFTATWGFITDLHGVVQDIQVKLTKETL